MAECSGLPPLPPLLPASNHPDRSPALSTLSSAQSKVGNSADAGEDGALAVAAEDDAVVDAVASLPALTKIWECKMIE